MREQLTVDNACRLAKALMELHGVSYDEALSRLACFRLNLVCGDQIADSVAMQAALVTAVNAGRRAFYGGVYVDMPEGVDCRLPWPGQPMLAEVCAELGAHLTHVVPEQPMQRIFFGQPRDPSPEDLVVSATGWRGCVSPAVAPVEITSTVDFALGGVFAGPLAVAKGFLRLAGIDARHHERAAGASLWDVGADWRDPMSDGPELQFLPQKLWMLGLGHLGQAYLWTLGLLPYDEPHQAQFWLQDFDRVVAANLGSGLVCPEASIGKLKTRGCAEWLESRRFQTHLIERAFDQRTVPNEGEAFVGLCGFDSASARRLLQNPGFDLVVEAGIGGDLENFDHVVLHTFPGATKLPQEIWAADLPRRIEPKLVQAFHPNGRCGVIAQTLAGKAISTAFVGAIAASFVVGEVLRGLHGGTRYEFLRFHCRRDAQPTPVHLQERYQTRFARSGYVIATDHTIRRPNLATPATVVNTGRYENSESIHQQAITC